MLRAPAVRRGRGSGGGEEKVYLRGDMKCTQNSDLVDRAGERREKEGGPKVP